MSSSEKEARLAQIRARADEATPGPWWIYPDRNYPDEQRRAVWHGDKALVEHVDATGSESLDDETFQRWDDSFTNGSLGDIAELDKPADARFIAAAREDVLWLLAEVDRLTAALRDSSVSSAPAPGRPA